MKKKTKNMRKYKVVVFLRKNLMHRVISGYLKSIYGRIGWIIFSLMVAPIVVIHILKLESPNLTQIFLILGP